MTGTSTTGDSGVLKEAVTPLFQGKQFWLSHNIPQRKWFKELIEPSTIQWTLTGYRYSFKYVEDSHRLGKLQNLENYRAGPSEARPVGATNIPTRGHKIPYTLEDDQLLWDWMQPHERNPKASIRGNKIYQELAEKVSRTPSELLKGHPRPGGMPESTDQPAPDGPSNLATRLVQSEPRGGSAQGVEPTAMQANDKKRKRASEDTPGEGNVDSTNKPSLKKRVTEVNIDLPDPFISGPQTKLAAVPHSATASNGQRPTPGAKEARERGATEGSKAPAKEPRQPSQPDPLFLELPFLPSDDEPEEEDMEQDIDAWIDERLLNGKAQHEEQIHLALRCTSMDPDLADRVLAILVEGKPIPDDMPGVWTPEDDKCIEGNETRGIQRVMEKHGTEAFNNRWEYLSMVREAGLLDTL
ncbi:TRF2-interacting telomeric protein/Rap1 C terminal domain-domain-containing protein [Aspergillus niger]|nr:TRF2-interacting telomeric protein/Rap1 C terminal domain-domain-containing protein [Aspergillus niger]